MTEPVTGAATEAPTEAPAEARSLPPVVRIPEPESQSRATIFFRVVLVFPHLVALYVMGLVAALMLFAGWVAALVLGRLPGPIFSFLSTYVRYATQIVAYTSLLTPRWPPFFAEASYPVDMELEPGRLNRLAVLFRLVLVLPAVLVHYFVQIGWLLFAFFFWVAALVKGRLPGSAHQATAAVVRYSARMYAYTYLLTPAYPWGLFGDRAPDAAEEAAEPDPRVLRLSRWARRLVVAFLVVGVLGYGGAIALAVSAGGPDLRARLALQDAWNELAAESEAFEREIGACDTAAEPLTCVQIATGGLAGDLDDFIVRVKRIVFPSEAIDEGTDMVQAATELRDAARMLSQARSGEDYQEIARATQIDRKGERLDDAYADLLRELS